MKWDPVDGRRGLRRRVPPASRAGRGVGGGAAAEGCLEVVERRGRGQAGGEGDVPEEGLHSGTEAGDGMPAWRRERVGACLSRARLMVARWWSLVAVGYVKLMSLRREESMLPVGDTGMSKVGPVSWKRRLLGNLIAEMGPVKPMVRTVIVVVRDLPSFVTPAHRTVQLCGASSG